MSFFLLCITIAVLGGYILYSRKQNKREQLEKVDQVITISQLSSQEVQDHLHQAMKNHAWKQYQFLQQHLVDLLLKRNDFPHALVAISSTLFLQLSGMEDHNKVRHLEVVFLSSSTIGQLRSTLGALSMTPEEYRHFFADQLFVALPFQYYSQPTMGEIIFNALQGNLFNSSTKAYHTNKPLPNHPDYHYTELCSSCLN